MNPLDPNMGMPDSLYTQPDKVKKEKNNSPSINQRIDTFVQGIVSNALEENEVISFFNSFGKNLPPFSANQLKDLQTAAARPISRYSNLDIINRIKKLQPSKVLYEILDTWSGARVLGENRQEALKRILTFLSDQKTASLDLSDLHLSSLPPIFDYPPMRKLDSLSLEGNQLKDFPLSILNLEQLEFLNLDRNPINEVPASLFEMKLMHLVLPFSFRSGNRTINLSELDPKASTLTWVDLNSLKEALQGNNAEKFGADHIINDDGAIPLKALYQTINGNIQSLNDFVPTSESTKKSCSLWNCIGERKTQDGDSYFLFERSHAENIQNPFPPSQPASANFLGYLPAKYRAVLNKLGMRQVKFQRNENGLITKVDNSLMILPSIDTLRKTLNNFRKNEYLNQLTIIQCEGLLTDEQFAINIKYDFTIANDTEFVHDITMHTIPTLCKICTDPLAYMSNIRITRQLVKQQLEKIHLAKKLAEMHPSQLDERIKHLVIKYEAQLFKLVGARVDQITNEDDANLKPPSKESIERPDLVIYSQESWKNYFNKEFPHSDPNELAEVLEAIRHLNEGEDDADLGVRQKPRRRRS